MPNYRRLFGPGGCYFFTVNLLDRNSRLLVEHADNFLSAVQETKQQYPFEIDAMVILPDHLHAIWTLPAGDSDFSVRWRWIKIRFSRSIAKREPINAVRKSRGERGIWQRRFWEHLIRDERDLQNHIDYCWYNPVKHGHVANVQDWPFSTFHERHPDALKPGDFERASAKLAPPDKDARFGERD